VCTQQIIFHLHISVLNMVLEWYHLVLSFPLRFGIKSLTTERNPCFSFRLSTHRNKLFTNLVFLGFFFFFLASPFIADNFSTNHFWPTLLFTADDFWARFFPASVTMYCCCLFGECCLPSTYFQPVLFIANIFPASAVCSQLFWQVSFSVELFPADINVTNFFSCLLSTANIFRIRVFFFSFSLVEHFLADNRHSWHRLAVL